MLSILQDQAIIRLRLPYEFIILGISVQIILRRVISIQAVSSKCGGSHSLPFAVKGKCGSVHIKLMPAPKGKGLVVEKELAKIMHFAGLSDIWSKAHGQTKVKINLIKAAFKALRRIASTKTAAQFLKRSEVMT